MASIRYSIQSKNNPATIYLRLSIDRNHIFKRKTPLIVNPKNWSIKRGKALEKDIVEKNLNLELSNLEAKLIESLNSSQRSDEIINSDWLGEEINTFFNNPTLKKDEINYSILSNYLEYFLSEKEKQQKKGLISLGTLKKYISEKNSLIKFQNYSKISYKILDIDKNFIDKLEKFCDEVLKYNTNTTGRFVKFTKGIAVHARDNKGISTSNELNTIKGYTAKVFKTYLSFEELDLIEGSTYLAEYLDNAKDWLIIGCYTGQRVSDLLRFNKDNLINIEGKDLIQIKQKKTQKLVSIPIHPRVKKILDKRDWNFPRKISDQKFNKYIKEVCEKAGLNELSKGLKYNSETKKRELGIFPKWELVTSHICRRSFATNFYGKIPTSLIIGITAHSTEKQYLEYVGRPEQDKSLQVADIWEKEELENQKTK